MQITEEFIKSAVESRERARFADQFPALSFEEMAEICPELAEIKAQAEAYHKDKSPDFCTEAAWYGYPASGHAGIKWQLERLVGWHSPHLRLSGAKAYDMAYRTIYDALPHCRGNCGC